MKTQLEFTAVFMEDKEEGGYIAYLKEIDGISTQGDTLEEAKENLIDAFQLAMEYKSYDFNKTRR